MAFRTGPHYHRAILKLAFHYFLWAFPQFSGAAAEFGGVRATLAGNGNPDEHVEALGPVTRPGFPDPGTHPHFLLEAAVLGDRVRVFVRMLSGLAWRVTLGASPSPLLLYQTVSHVACYTKGGNGRDGVILGSAEFKYRCEAGVRMVTLPGSTETETEG